ncbi:hypothetical protein [Siphonobacter sp. SORGH_AS_1065]|uniref:hypothetical protein n=1 Tax=Siphonobacter sp. SORGH_AS_1065 TaxID=3041795 RepID=UPI002785D593|nr:hypothetical protein [Siphonobacter sp. SORGH_AS_1065]MDQ1087189.1 hypothetical protein [Siphonobacter sp. SORGH_AS_1065]
MNTNNTNTQSKENEAKHLKDVFGGQLPEIADDLSMLLTMAVGSEAFTEAHASERIDLTFRTLELIKTFRAAS